MEPCAARLAQSRAQGRTVAYSLTYIMLTGRGRRIAEAAGEAVLDHAAMVLAGASGIVIRDGHSVVVTLASVIAQAKLDGD